MDLSLPEYCPSSRNATEWNGWSDQYGAINIACDYAAYKDAGERFRALWLHGCIGPWECQLPGRLTYNRDEFYLDWPVYVARKEEENVLRERGFKLARAIGLPFVYAQSDIPTRTSRSLLVVPTHSLAGYVSPNPRAYRQYANEIAEQAQGFKHVVACIHPACWKNGFWVDEFMRVGIPVIEGADPLDRNALKRMRIVFEGFEYVTSNGWGSHIAYALAQGAKVSIFGTKPEFSAEVYATKDDTWNRDRNALERLLAHETVAAQDHFLAKLYVEPSGGIADRELGEWLIGADNKVSQQEMRDILRTVLHNTPWEIIRDQVRRGVRFVRRRR